MGCGGAAGLSAIKWLYFVQFVGWALGVKSGAWYVDMALYMFYNKTHIASRVGRQSPAGASTFRFICGCLPQIAQANKQTHTHTHTQTNNPTRQTTHKPTGKPPQPNHQTTQHTLTRLPAIPTAMPLGLSTWDFLGHRHCVNEPPRQALPLRLHRE